MSSTGDGGYEPDDAWWREGGVDAHDDSSHNWSASALLSSAMHNISRPDAFQLWYFNETLLKTYNLMSLVILGPLLW